MFYSFMLYGFGYWVKIKKLKKRLVSTLLKQFVGADMQVMNKYSTYQSVRQCQKYKNVHVTYDVPGRFLCDFYCLDISGSP